MSSTSPAINTPIQSSVHLNTVITSTHRHSHQRINEHSYQRISITVNSSTQSSTHQLINTISTHQHINTAINASSTLQHFNTMSPTHQPNVINAFINTVFKKSTHQHRHQRINTINITEIFSLFFLDWSSVVENRGNATIE
jgi:hypothetical protein